MSVGKSPLLALIVALNILPAVRAAAPAAAQTEINHLLGLIEQSGCEFFRNGTWYNAQRAQAHLRAKYDVLAASDQIKTAEDFIEKAASKSSLSGLPYQIRCGGGAAITTKQWFDEALVRYRNNISRSQQYQPQRSLRTARCAPYARTLSICITSNRQSSILTVRSLWTEFTCSVSRAREPAFSIASWLLAVPVSHTTPFLSVST